MRWFSILCISAAGCAGPVQSSARANIQPLDGRGYHGQLSFNQTREGVLIRGEVRGLPPNTAHGMHVHEVGDCSSPKAPKGHFNPEGDAHGASGQIDSHMGDLGNILADANGVARISVLKHGAMVKGGVMAYQGRALIIHEGKDDMRSQPAGDAGKPAACGVIR